MKSELKIRICDKVNTSILKNGVLFTLNWLPLGGFVKLQGENDSASKKGDYGAATFWQKTKILFAGVVINWLAAVVLLMALAFFCAIQGLMRKRSSGFYSLMTVFKTDSAGEICFSKAC